MNSLIAPTKKLGYSNIFLDFLNNTGQVKTFYPAGSLDEVASALDKHTFKREELAKILMRQNQDFGSSQPVFDNIKKLKDNKTLTVFTGQQAGLFGGSLLVLIKALSIVKSIPAL